MFFFASLLLMGSAKRVHLWISGRVQGVYFRQTARQTAARLGVGGWARNLADGRVEAAAEGPAVAVEAFVAWCRRGPDGARVDAVDVTSEDPAGETEFVVLPTL